MRDYVAWHDEYGEPGSRLHRRLQVVIELIGQALDGSPSGPIRFVSLCAGQGHDILSVAATHPRGRDLTGRLVELDPVNATAAAARIEELGLTGIEVRTADAGTTDAYEGAVPADGRRLRHLRQRVPGRHRGDDRALPSLCAPGAWVAWTRHPREPGVLPAIAEWFEASGFEREALVVDDDAWFGVGLHRLAAEPAPYTAGQRLFTFVR